MAKYLKAPPTGEFLDAPLSELLLRCGDCVVTRHVWASQLRRYGAWYGA